MKLCPKCEGLMTSNSYFGEWICDTCDYREPIKNDLWVEELQRIIYNGISSLPSQESMMNKINEIIKVVNQVTNPRV